MPIHAARIDRSARLMRIIELLQAAEHPLSSQEISVRAYNFALTGKVMLNVSTNIGEMRAPVNQNLGYNVSTATQWQEALTGHEPGKKIDKDGGVTFLLQRATQPWHDGRPRFYLIAAPGWVPRWRVTEVGLMVPYTESGGVNEWKRPDEEAGTGERATAETDVPKTCRLARCGMPIPPDKPDNTEFCCTSHKDEYWKNIREPGKALAAESQGKLF